MFTGFKNIEITFSHVRYDSMTFAMASLMRANSQIHQIHPLFQNDFLNAEYA